MIPAGVTDLACAVDSHAHVYDVERYPFHPSSAFTLLPNEPGNAAAYGAVLDAHGITHALLVQPLGGYGVDNRYLLEAIAASGGRFRGVAVVPHDIGDRELDALGAGGVVGVRFNLNHAASPPLEGPGGSRTLARAHDRGWFAQIHRRLYNDVVFIEPAAYAASLAAEDQGYAKLIRDLRIKAQ